MTAWRLEWLRLTRTARGISLLAVYAFYGLLGPILAKYMADIIKNFQSDSSITVTVKRPPLPRDGFANFISQVGQVGLVVTVVVAAGALGFDSRKGLSTFFRTRTRRLSSLVLPRTVVPALAAVVAYTVGTVAAWYETVILIGPLPVGQMITGWAMECVFLIFVVAVVAAASSVVRGTLATAGLAIGFLLVFPIIGVIGTVHDWLPSTLMAAPSDLLNGTSISHFAPALIVTVALCPCLLAGAVRRLGHRDV